MLCDTALSAKPSFLYQPRSIIQPLKRIFRVIDPVQDAKELPIYTTWITSSQDLTAFTKHVSESIGNLDT